jgi:hypothetical protein
MGPAGKSRRFEMEGEGKMERKNGTKVAIALAVLGGLWFGCVEESEPFEPGVLEQHHAISDCGGFAANAGDPGTDEEGADGYCDAELLNWAYDDETQALEMTDARLVLNCCGERTMAMEYVEGVYVVTETDAPEGDVGARCDCVCVFDIALAVEGLPEETIPVRLQRVVTDEMTSPVVIWEGDLRLGDGEGSVVLDPEPLPEGMCSEP